MRDINQTPLTLCGSISPIPPPLRIEVPQHTFHAPLSPRTFKDWKVLKMSFGGSTNLGFRRNATHGSIVYLLFPASLLLGSDANNQICSRACFSTIDR